jgi:hypothetical protein
MIERSQEAVFCGKTQAPSGSTSLGNYVSVVYVCQEDHNILWWWGDLTTRGCGWGQRGL